MTDIERFLAGRKVYRCERLSANLTVEQCEINRQRKDNFANDLMSCGPCKTCPGLNTSEEITMPSKRGVCAGCGKVRSLPAKDLCGSCYQKEKTTPDPVVVSPKRAGRPAPEPMRKYKPRAPKITAPAILADYDGCEVKPAVPMPTLSAADVILTDQMSEIDAIWQAKRTAWREDLVGATSASSMARIFLAQISALESMEY